MNVRSRKVIVLTSIVLIAVTVAVSIAVLEWMDASKSYLYPAFDEVYITNMSFDVTNKIITVTVNNTGISSVTINEVRINNVTQNSVSPMLPSTIEAKNGVAYTITLVSLSSGQRYQVRLISIKGYTFLYTATAPS